MVWSTTSSSSDEPTSPTFTHPIPLGPDSNFVAEHTFRPTPSDIEVTRESAAAEGSLTPVPMATQEEGQIPNSSNSRKSVTVLEILEALGGFDSVSAAPHTGQVAPAPDTPDTPVTDLPGNTPSAAAPHQHKEGIHPEHITHARVRQAASLEALTTIVDSFNITVADLADSVAVLRSANSSERALATIASLAEGMASLALCNSRLVEGSTSDGHSRINSLVATVQSMTQSLEKIKHNRVTDTQQALEIVKLNQKVEAQRITIGDRFTEIKRLETELQSARDEQVRTKTAMARYYAQATEEMKTRWRITDLILSQGNRMQAELKAARAAHEEDQTTWKAREQALLRDKAHLAAELNDVEGEYKATESGWEMREVSLLAELEQSVTELDDAHATIDLFQEAVRHSKSEANRLSDALKDLKTTLMKAEIDRDNALAAETQAIEKFNEELATNCSLLMRNSYCFEPRKKSLWMEENCRLFQAKLVAHVKEMNETRKKLTETERKLEEADRKLAQRTGAADTKDLTARAISDYDIMAGLEQNYYVISARSRNLGPPRG